MAGKKDKSVLFWLFFIFCTSVLVRFYLAFRFGGINNFLDEAFYWNLSRNFFQGAEMNFRGLPCYDRDLLYPLLISVSHYLGDFDKIYYGMVLINGIVSSSVIFPVYLLSCSVLKDKRKSFLVVVASIMIPEMFYSAKIVQENLFYPYSMWMFWAFYTFLLPRKYSFKRAAILALLFSIAPYIKQAGICLMVSYLLFYAVQAVFYGNLKQKITCVAIAVESAALCLAVDILISYIFFRTSNQLYYSIVGKIIDRGKYMFASVLASQMYPTLLRVCVLAIAVVVSYILLRVILLHFYGEESGRKLEWINKFIMTILIAAIMLGGMFIFHRYFYPNITYIVYTYLFWGIIIPIIPIAYIRVLEPQERDFVIMSILAWLVINVATCLSVLNINTEIRQGTIRIHYRYIYYYFIPFLIMFFCLFRRIQEKGFQWGLALASAVYAVVTVFAMQAASWDIIAAPSLAFWEKILAMPHGELAVKAIIVLTLVGSNVLIFGRHTKKLYVSAYALLTAMFLLNSASMYAKNVAENLKPNITATCEDGKKIRKYLNEQNDIENSTDVLLAAALTENYGMMDACMDVPYRACLWKDLLLLTGTTENETISFDMLDLYARFPNIYLQSAIAYRISPYQGPKYIVSQGPLKLNGYHMEDIHLRDYYLYICN